MKYEVTEEAVEAACKQYDRRHPILNYHPRPEDMRSALTAALPHITGCQPTHRHKKRGTEYELIGIGKMQAENWRSHPFGQNMTSSYDAPVDMREVAIYRSVDDGSLWVRPIEEFNDGRFEPLPPAPDAVP